jgi:hypothetical protein
MSVEIRPPEDLDSDSFRDPQEVVIFKNFGIFKFSDKWSIIQNIVSLWSLASFHSEDSVGFLPAGEDVALEMALPEAFQKLKATGGYINGWEYLAGDCGAIFEDISAPIEDMVKPHSLLSNFGPPGRMLDSVMKWIFVSNGSSPSSSWHLDPIGSCAWMLQIHGSKKWQIELNDRTLECFIEEGDFLILPSGLRHRVKNRGDGFNFAVSHNWVSIGGSSETNMWLCLHEAVSALVQRVKTHAMPVSQVTVYDSLEYLRSECEIDNLVFGLVMMFIHMSSSDCARRIPPRLSELSTRIEYLHSLVGSG